MTKLTHSRMIRVEVEVRDGEILIRLPVEQLAKRGLKIREAQVPSGLTRRQSQVYTGILQGMDAPAIAKQLGVTVACIKFHVWSTAKRLGYPSAHVLREVIAGRIPG
jgi:DNA-binding NarL/FixJ family response regulator